MLISPEGTNSLQGLSFKNDNPNTPTDTSVGLRGTSSDVPNTLTSEQPELVLLKRITTINKTLDTTPRSHKKSIPKSIQQPPFFVAVYRTQPLDPLPLPPLPTWKNPYSHIHARVDCHRP